MVQRTIILGAAGRDFHNFNVFFRDNPDYQVVIESYTDSRGDEVTLQQLTQERARQLSERFQAAGVDASRIQANGMGTSNPLANNTTPAGRTRNRRIEIHVPCWATGGMTALIREPSFRWASTVGCLKFT